MHEWKQIDDKTSVMEVPGGLVYRYEWLEESGNGISLAGSMVFVPVSKSDLVQFRHGETGARGDG